jgi:acyl-CoA thioester hydrolase
MEATMRIETYRGFVYPWSMDHVGHMNVQFYTARFDEATWHFFAHLGITPGWLKENRRGMVALDQRTQYKQEVLSGSLLHVTTELLEIKPKTVRFLHRMFNSESGQEVATTELVGAFLDAELRKTTPFPQFVHDAAQTLLAAHGAP